MWIFPENVVTFEQKKICDAPHLIFFSADWMKSAEKKIKRGQIHMKYAECAETNE